MSVANRMKVGVDLLEVRDGDRCVVVVTSATTLLLITQNNNYLTPSDHRNLSSQPLFRTFVRSRETSTSHASVSRRAGGLPPTSPPMLRSGGGRRGQRPGSAPPPPRHTP